VGRLRSPAGLPFPAGIFEKASYERPKTNVVVQVKGYWRGRDGGEMSDKLTVKVVGPSSCHLIDGTNWPLPDVDDGESGLEWQLRYGNPETREAIRFQVAAIVGAFTALIYKSAKRRNDIVRCLRDAAAQRCAAEEESKCIYQR
jgi:hypothetical protein